MKRLLFFICICFACVLTMQAQNSKYLALHDTVTIRNESNMYLTVDDKGTTIIAHGEPNDNALWKIVGCSYTNSSRTSQYQFQHVKTEKYLHVEASKSGNNKYTVSLGLSDNTPSLFTGNNPSGDSNSHEVPGYMYYTFDSKKFTLTYDNTWKLPQNKSTKIYIEKWSAKGNGGLSFKTYFSPETYDFKLVKSTDDNPITDESITQQKKVRFVLDMRDSLYTTCVRPNISTKKLLVSFTEERNLENLKNNHGIIPTFYWQSTGSAKGSTSTLTLLSSNASQEDFKYFSEVETTNRKMMEITGGDISSDKLAWEVMINTYGISPMSLVNKYNDGKNHETKRLVNYTDFLVVEWQYGGKTYTEKARIIRKSYHTRELPQFDISVSPSTFTFNNGGGTQTLNISGYHQHGVAYYDADERIVENVYTYGPNSISLKDVDGDKNDLEVTFEFKDLAGTPITWLKEEPQTRTPYSITVAADPNTAEGAQYRQARVHGTFTLTGDDHPHKGTIAPIINQRANNDDITFKHVDGIGRNPLEGTERQQVHTVERTIYYTSEQSGGIQLQLAESNFFGYMRWYDYATDGDPTWNANPAIPTSWVTVPRGANGTNFKAINTSAGHSFGLYGTHREGQEGPLHRENADNPAPVLKAWNYEYDANAKEDAEKAASGYHTIACDVSAYTNYQITRNGNRVLQINEPTLSYRQLFHLKPAEEMANKLKKVSEITPSEHTPATFLENYKYLAARGVDVHLATNYRYAKYTHQSELCYFYYDKDNKLKRVGKDVQAEWWYTDKNGIKSKVNNPNYQVKDFLDIDSDFEGDVVYELIVPTASTLGYDLRIARFEITFVLKGACGPSQSTIMTTHEMNEHYQLLEHIDFSFRDNNGNLTATEYNLNGYKQLDYHLPWEQSTYGYYYPTARIGENNCWTTTNRIDQGIPYYGEYFLVNKMNKDWAKATAHGGEDDYALYVDGTTEPGRAFSISTQANICAGQTLYCSAWLCNPCPTSHTWNNPRDPIFRCNVEGRVKDVNGVWGEWEDVSVFFVGSLAKGSGWQQIVFPVLSDKSYDETRVSIYNFATGGNGNDFMVDDISLFVSRLPLASYQAQTNCSSDANTESSTAVVLRIDYTDFQGERDQYMYYQIFKEKNVYDPDDTAHPIELQYTTNENSAYFHDNPANSDAKTYGSVRIPTKTFDPEDHNATEGNEKVLIFQTVQGFKDYLVDQVKNNPNGEKSTHAKAYIQTTDSRGQSKWLIYVMHIIPNAKEDRDEQGNPVDGAEINEKKYLRESYNYSLRMANVPEELAAPECNLQTPLHSTQATHFDLHNGDKEEVDRGFIPRSLDKCANDYYTLTSVIENVMAITTGGDLHKVRGEVLSDWLVGFDFDDVYADTKTHTSEYQAAVRAAEVAFKNQYGYTRAQVKTAILYDLRRDDPLNTNRDKGSFDQLDQEAFADPFNYDVIKHLHDNGWLQLRKSSTSFYLASEEAVRYWVYPIDGTAETTYQGYNVVLQDCTEPIWVHVASDASNHVLNIAPVKNAEKTDAQKRQIPTVRVLHSTLTDNTKTITIPITDINTETTKNLVGVEDTKNTKIEFSLSNLNDNIHFVDSTTGQKIDVPTTFEIGKTYMMRMRFADNGGNIYVGGDAKNCRVGTVYFRLLILPDRVIWAPTTGIYDGWGLDGNWKGWNDADNDGQIDEGELTEGFVPMAGSDVIIGNVPTNGVTLPTIDEYEHYPYVHDHNHYPMHVNASPFTCGKIYFAPGAHIHNQHLLQYDKAFVDMVIPSATWNTVSAPLQNMYSGDMFVPHDGMWDDDDTKIPEPNPFVVSNFLGTRHRDAAYAFSQAFYNQTVEKHYENKAGVNVSASAAFVTSNALSQKLEPAHGYSMRGYGPGNPQSEKTLTIRLPKPDTEYYYYDTQGNETTQTTGQLSRTNAGRLAFTPSEGEDPSMQITLKNEVSGANQSFLFGNPTMALIDMQKLYKDNTNTAWTSAYSYITDNQWGASTQALDGNGRFLPPMTSVMLHTNSDATSLTINLKPSHLTLSTTDAIQHQDGEPQPVAPRQSAATTIPKDRPMTMSLYAYTDRASARTTLAASPTANDSYQVGEDALFISSGVEMSNVVVTPLNMYTLSEQVPMMADVRENIDSIPVGLLAKDNYRSDSITFAFHLSANWDKECYFYDALTDTRYRIMDGMFVSLPMPQNHENRYFILGPDDSSNGGIVSSTTQPTRPDEHAIHIWAYAPNQGELIVCSNDIIQEVKVYDVAGRLIAHQVPQLQYNTLTIPCPAGVCIVEATTRDRTQHYTRTIVK